MLGLRPWPAVRPDSCGLGARNLVGKEENPKSRANKFKHQPERWKGEALSVSNDNVHLGASVEASVGELKEEQV